MSAEAKPTPGPWHVEGGTTLIWGACYQIDQSSFGMGYPIAKCHTLLGPEPYHKRGSRPDEACANARLIAAAPKLLAALQAMLNHSCVADSAAEDKDEEDHAAERLARAAVAEATGAAP